MDGNVWKEAVVERAGTHHRAEVGDLVEVVGHGVGESGRTGEVLDVLGDEKSEHFLVRWEDGHESLFYPSNDAVFRHPGGRASTARPVSGGDVMRALEDKAVGYELMHHERTMTAADEATAVGAAPEEVAKTLVLVTPEGHARAVVSASDKLSIRKARDLFGGKKASRLATEDELASDYPMFELGAVPPFGGPMGDRVIVDSRLAACESVVIEAGSHDESVRMKTSDLLALTQAQVADIHVD